MARQLLALAILGLLTTTPQLVGEQPAAARKSAPWCGLHVIVFKSDKDLEILGRQVAKLAALGVNVLILEVNYNFAFQSHPELRAGKDSITAAGAARLAALCRKHGVRLIPEFQCVGHQSWRGQTFPLLTLYPQLDLTPGAFPGNKSIYCREWDPLNPEVNKIVLPLLDEIIDAFHADALHVGMDEVFLLGSEQSPSTKGKAPSVLFADAVKQIHKHLMHKHVEMLMWGDRLIDGSKYDFGEWEASTNGTAAAIELIPKDIIICPWHYEVRDSYPSIPMFIEKGFRVLPASWKNVDATKALISFSRSHSNPKVLGFMFTTWGVRKDVLLDFPPLVEGLKALQD